MGKHRKKRNRKQLTKEDLGSVEFFCKHCNHTFKMPWCTIFDIQEITHGYVGFHLNDVYIECPECEEPIEEDHYEPNTNDINPFTD